MEATTSSADLVALWLQERGLGFVCTPEELPWQTLGAERDPSRSALSNFFKRGLLDREPGRDSHNRPTFRYTVTQAMIDYKPSGRARPVVLSRNRPKGEVRGPIEKVETIESLCKTIVEARASMDAAVEKLVARAGLGLTHFTNAQLIAELHRRSHADVGVST